MNDLTKDELVKMAREAGAVEGANSSAQKHGGNRQATPTERLGNHMTKRLMLLADTYASAYKNNLAIHPLVERSRAALESALEDELSKLRGLIAGRSAEHLAAHITYDKGYQEGRLDAEAALKPVAEIGVSVFTWLGDRPPAGTTLYRIEQPSNHRHRSRPAIFEGEREMILTDDETCTWTEQDDKDMPGTYESSCGEMWSFIDGGVKENRVTYCHHCGGKVVPASPQEQT